MLAVFDAVVLILEAPGRVSLFSRRRSKYKLTVFASNETGGRSNRCVPAKKGHPRNQRSRLVPSVQSPFTRQEPTRIPVFRRSNAYVRKERQSDCKPYDT